MPEPVTITLLAINGLGWLAGTMAGALTGGTTDRAFKSAVRGVRDRLAGIRGVPENHDIAHAVRLAQLQALERVIRDYRARGRPEWKTEPHTRPDLFFDRALAFTARAIGRSQSFALEQNLEVTEQLTSTVDGVLAPPAHDGPALERSAAVGSLAEDAVLDELRRALDGVVCPEGFESQFRRGADRYPRFLDLFAAYIGEQIKSNDRFRAIFTTGQRSRLDGLAMETADLVRGIDARFGSALARIESAIDSHGAMLAEILAKVSADKGVPAAPLRAVLERMGEGDVPVEDIATRLAAKAEEYLALREQWAKVAETRSDLAAVRQEAFAKLEKGELEGARALISSARERLRDARKVAARDEATLLADEAQVDMLALRYRDAAVKYGEAEALVAFDPDAVSKCRARRANALLMQGEEFGDNAALVEALVPLRALVDETPREQDPRQWAKHLLDVGYGLAALGRRERGSARLEEAVGIYRSTLEELSRDEEPDFWAAAQNNLASALVVLAERSADPDLLEEAIIALRAALEVRSRDQSPAEWGDAHQNLGNALITLGERRNDVTLIEEGMRAFEEAVHSRSRELQPLRWTAAMNGLAAARAVLGARRSDPELLAASAEAYREALKVGTRERAPLEWAATNNNLGGTLRQLGGMRHNRAALEEAIGRYGDALEEFTRERVPRDWARTQANLGITLHLLGLETGEPDSLEAAVVACRRALEEMTGTPRHMLWSTVQYSLGHSLGLLGERVGPLERFREAADAFRASLETRDPAREAPTWALTQFNLGTSLRLYAEKAGDTGAMAEAIEAYRAALSIPLPEEHAELRSRAREALDEVTSPRPAPPPA
jgi:tetratricopeptide (TPR) repeat protein